MLKNIRDQKEELDNKETVVLSKYFPDGINTHNCFTWSK